MKLLTTPLVYVGIVLTLGVSVLGSSHKMYVIPSWGDMVVAYAAGTDPAMDSPDAIGNMIEHWKRRGYTGVHLRTDLAQIEPLIRRNPVEKQQNPRLAVMWKRVDEVMQRYNIHALTQRIADAHGFEYWAWHPHLYSDGAPEYAGSPGPGRMWPWSYVSKYTYEHPECIATDRKGNRYWMIREYAYPGARSSKVDEFVHMARNEGLRRFIACMRSEASQVQPAADKADRYGFNEPVVSDMKTLFGVDIRTDPRFDVDSPDFDPCDPMVQNWHNLRGIYVTQLFRELREHLNRVDPNIKIAVTLSGDYTGPVIGNIRLDWRRWINEGLIDEIIAPVTYEASLDHEADSKGYLTHLRAGKGKVSFSTLRDYIDTSKHPEIKIVSTSAPSYFQIPPPPATDGWRCDVWYDSYTLAWYQRWEQWKRDLNEFGHIKFFEQSFDSFPKNDTGFAGGRGDMFYRAGTRACEGCWYPLGDGSDSKPVVQSSLVRADRGNAIKLTRDPHHPTVLTGWHNSAPDRSKYTSCVDNAITNGLCTFEYWLYRDGDNSSVAVFFQSSDEAQEDVGLYVSSNEGRVLHKSGIHWIQSTCRVPTRKWLKFTLQVNCDERAYSAYAATDDRMVPICQDIAYSVPTERHVAIPGVNIPIRVPAYRMFNQVRFVPEGPAGSVTYLDDVRVQWVPTMYYVKPGPCVCLSDNFESHPVDAGIDGTRPDKGSVWEVTPDESTAYFVDNDTSFGEGVKCLHATGAAEIVARLDGPADPIAGGMITVDLDVFIRSDKKYACIVPDPNTTSEHRTSVTLDNAQKDVTIAGIHAGDGSWEYWHRGRYVDSRIRINYDVWNHIQMALDTSRNSCRIVVQPLGELPILLGQVDFKGQTQIDDKLLFRIRPSPSTGHLSCYDNISIRWKPRATVELTTKSERPDHPPGIDQVSSELIEVKLGVIGR